MKFDLKFKNIFTIKFLMDDEVLLGIITIFVTFFVKN